MNTHIHIYGRRRLATAAGLFRTTTTISSVLAATPRLGPSTPSLTLRRGVRIHKVWGRGEVAEQEKSGHIAVGQNESLLFFDNLFPLRIGNFLRRPWQTDEELADLLRKFNSNSAFGPMDPIGLVKAAVPVSAQLKVTEILPRLKEGGAFVKFSHAPKADVGQIEDALIKALHDNPISPWFNPFRNINAGPVRGVPWLEDLHRLPQTRLRVEFAPDENGNPAPPDLSQEALYSLFRKYGKIQDIVSQEADSKITPRFAYVDFVFVRDAIMARNCLHGFVVSEGKIPARLRLSYEARRRASTFWTWITSHPRVVIPVLAAVLAAVTVIVFDPIRQFFIRSRIQQTYKVDNNRIVKWFKSQTSDIMTTFGNLKPKRSPTETALNAVWTHRRNLVDKMRAWLVEDTETFIVVQGPRGSGKRELVLDEVLKDRTNVLVIDCKAIVEGRGESGTISKLAAAVGYSPVFSWVNSISSIVDLAIQGTTGVKSGFSETLESQVVKILQTTASALKDVALAERTHAHTEASDDAFLEAHPERRPVVVIENFIGRHDNIVYEKVADWAALLTQSNVAHVIFLTEDGSYSKSLSRVQPDRVFRQISLGDLTPDIAKKFILTRLRDEHLADGQVPLPADSTTEKTLLDQAVAAIAGAAAASSSAQTAATAADGSSTPLAPVNADLSQLDRCIDIIGGRRTDLEALVRRLKNGQGLMQATDEIIEQAATEIIKVFLLGKPTDSTPRTWSSQQAWHLIKQLATAPSLSEASTTLAPSVGYSDVLLSPIFDKSISSPAPNADAALANLIDAELITVTHHRGRERAVRPGKPTYAAAFSLLVADHALCARMDHAVLDELARIHTKTIDKVEAELAVLGTLPKQPNELAARVHHLLAKLSKAQENIEMIERNMAMLKKMIQTEEVD